MINLSIDYTKVAPAESTLYHALRHLASDDISSATICIKTARLLLNEFTNSDNNLIIQD